MIYPEGRIQTILLKGLLRDPHRSLFPLSVVTIGVMLTVLLHCWITGVMGDMIDFNAKFLTGHVKIMTKAFAENMDQIPNDLALVGVDELLDNLHRVWRYGDAEFYCHRDRSIRRSGYG